MGEQGNGFKIYISANEQKTQTQEIFWTQEQFVEDRWWTLIYLLIIVSHLQAYYATRNDICYLSGKLT